MKVHTSPHVKENSDVQAHIIGSNKQVIDAAPYEAEFKLMFSQVDISYIISDPNSLIGAMADMKFSKSEINIIRNIVFNSSDLLIKIMRKEDCDIRAISK